MNIRAVIQKIKKSFSHQEELPTEAVLGFLHVLESVQEEGCSCDEVFTKIDEYVEREVDKKDAEDLMPLVREHLDLCPDCCEEYEALLDVLEKTSKKQK
jgi:UDP-N-acetylmuramyl tripeptide synthase